MDCLPGRAGCKQEVRPPPCGLCSGPRWWDGWRRVKWQATLTPDGLTWVEGPWRRRTRCFNPECDSRSSTLYEAQAYPYRTFAPAVAVAAVLELLSVEGATVVSVAQLWQCDPRTLDRWLGWIGWLAELAVLLKVCWRYDPSGMPPPVFQPRRKDLDPPTATTKPTWKDRATLIGSLVLLFEWLARLHRDHGIPLEEGPGLSALLRRQFDRYRLVSMLTKRSPPMQTQVLWSGG
jgi:hypothetical protein